MILVVWYTVQMLLTPSIFCVRIFNYCFLYCKIHLFDLSEKAIGLVTPAVQFCDLFIFITCPIRKPPKYTVRWVCVVIWVFGGGEEDNDDDDDDLVFGAV